MGAALEVATDACARAAHAALRRERHRLARHHLPAHQYTATLRDAIAAGDYPYPTELVMNGSVVGLSKFFAILNSINHLQ